MPYSDTTAYPIGCGCSAQQRRLPRTQPGPPFFARFGLMCAFPSPLLFTDPLQPHALLALALGIAMAEDDIVKRYDRQIRLWGLDTQRGILGARILFVGVDGLIREVAKNLVLRASTRVCVQDGSDVSAADVGAGGQFCVAAADAGKKGRAEATVEKLREPAGGAGGERAGPTPTCWPRTTTSSPPAAPPASAAPAITALLETGDRDTANRRRSACWPTPPTPPPRRAPTAPPRCHRARRARLAAEAARVRHVWAVRLLRLRPRRAAVHQAREKEGGRRRRRPDRRRRRRARDGDEEVPRALPVGAPGVRRRLGRAHEARPQAVPGFTAPLRRRRPGRRPRRPPPRGAHRPPRRGCRLRRPRRRRPVRRRARVTSSRPSARSSAASSAPSSSSSSRGRTRR